MTVSHLKSAILAVVAAGLAWALAPTSLREGMKAWLSGRAQPATQTVAEAPVAVKAMRVGLQPVQDRIEALGTLKANESVALSAPVTDVVSRVLFEDGQRVEKDQVLVEMVTAEERALQQEARSSVEEARSQYERAKDLASRKFTSESVLDQRRREYETSEARLKVIEARLADREIRAPFAGTMGLRNVSVGALITPETTIALIEDDSVLKLDFSVASTMLPTLKAGMEIVGRASGFEGEEFRGAIASLDNKVDEVTRTIRVRALVPNPDRRLRPGLLMTVDLLKSARQALMVREAAIVPAGSDAYVYILDTAAGTVKRRKVATGVRRKGEVEVVDGLAAGDVVVVEGTLKLRDGVAVTPLAIEDKAVSPAGQEGGRSGGGRS